jgi:predicted small lipoprotein YifL
MKINKRVIALLVLLTLSFTLIACSQAGDTALPPDDYEESPELEEEIIIDEEKLDDTKVEDITDNSDEVILPDEPEEIEESTSEESNITGSEGNEDIKDSGEQKDLKYFVKFSIEGPDNDLIYSNDQYEIPSDTIIAIDLLLEVSKAENIKIDYMGSGRTTYLKGIEDYYEFDFGPLSGWIIQLNGEVPQRSMGVLEVMSGDTVRIRYTLELGNDFDD